MTTAADHADDELLRQARAGDPAARAALFERHRERLAGMVRLRLDRRLAGRVDTSDVLQEAFLDFDRRLGEYDGALPFYLWLRQLAGQRLTDLHRHHLGAQMRDAGREVSIYRGMPEASSAAIAAHLLGRHTSVSEAAQRAELRLRVQTALDALDPIDREALTLRHFEQLTNEEVAALLGLTRQAASARYIRALKRIGGLLKE